MNINMSAAPHALLLISVFHTILYYSTTGDTPAEYRGISLLPDMNSTDYSYIRNGKWAPLSSS